MDKRDEDLPQTRRYQPLDLEKMSVEEVEAYIVELEGEIARSRAAIESKKSLLSAAESVFRKP